MLFERNPTMTPAVTGRYIVPVIFLISKAKTAVPFTHFVLFELVYLFLYVCCFPEKPFATRPTNAIMTGLVTGLVMQGHKHIAVHEKRTVLVRRIAIFQCGT